MPNLVTFKSSVTFQGSGITKFSAANLESITNIRNYATFSDCVNLRELSIPKLVNFGVGEDLTASAHTNGWVANCTSLVEINLPAMTIVDTKCFSGCSSLAMLPNRDIKKIGISAFYNTAISGVLDLPNLEILQDGAFGKTKITGIENLGTVQTIGGNDFEAYWGGNYRVFGECANLTYVKLPSTLTKLGTRTFYNCKALRTIVCYAVTPPELTVSSSKDAFDGCASFTIYVPDESVEAYKTTEGWQNHATKIKPLSEFTE